MKRVIIGYFLFLSVFLLGGNGVAIAHSHAQGDHTNSLKKQTEQVLSTNLSLEEIQSCCPVIKEPSSHKERHSSENGAAENEEEEKEEKEERERTSSKNHVSSKNHLVAGWSNLSGDFFQYIPKSLAIRKHHKTFIASGPEESLNIILGVFRI